MKKILDQLIGNFKTLKVLRKFGENQAGLIYM